MGILSAIVLAIVLVIGYRQIQNYLYKPQAILMLGGSSSHLEREKFTAQFARQHPNLPVWVSSGGFEPGRYENYTRQVFADLGVDPDSLHFDYQAQDTLTNFTTLISELKARGIQSVYLITSDYHMRRARVVGEIVLGSQGISFRPVAVPSNQATESIAKMLRDSIRAVIWVLTGYTGRAIPSSTVTVHNSGQSPDLPEEDH